MIIIKNSIKSLEKIASELTKEKILGILKQKDRVVLGLVGGNSIKGVFSNLADISDILWHKVHIFLADERLVPKESQESNYRTINDFLIQNLIAQYNFPERNFHLFNYKPEKNDSDISEYQREFLGHTDKLDIAILSAANDGHIASLFPNHPSVLDESDYFIKVENSPKPPAKRMSASRKLLERTKYPLLLFFGEGKEQAYKNFENPKVDFIYCPAKILQKCQNLYVLTDL